MKSTLPLNLLLLCLTYFTLSIPAAFSQNFTRVINSLNPVTTDTAESGGASWIDINNDGLLDLFVSNGNLSDQNNSLYLGAGNGNFIKVTTGNIVNDGGSSIGSTWADYDNDGNLDCFVTNRNNFGNFLYHGNGDTVFTKVSTGNIVTDIGDSNSSSWVDVNNDGVLDLYVVNFMGNDFFYSGDGFPSYTFTPVTNAITAGSTFSIPGAWADYNNDLLPDLFVGNAGTQNDFFFTNNGNLSFTQTTLNDVKSTLGASWGDYDNDGNLDLFVANYLNDESILYHNSGAPLYTLIPVAGSAVSISGNSVGSAWGDVDNDGDLDLFVCDDGGNNHLFLNDGLPNYTFTAVTSGAIVTDGGNSFGCVFGDYDNDGQLDLFVANRLNQQNILYHNNGSTNNWMTIKCIGATANESGIGTKVLIRATINGNSIWQMQEVDGQTGYNSQNLWLHFGLGNATIADTVIVRWPSGNMDTCFNINSNQMFSAIEGQCLIPTAINNFENSGKDLFLVSLYPNPANDNLSFNYNLTHAENVEVRIVNVSGKTVFNKIISKGIAGINRSTVDIKKLSKGFYTLVLTGRSQSSKGKFIKE